MNTANVSLGRAAKISRAEMALNLLAQTEDHRIAKANKRFNRASAAAKRVLIAKDVLAWLATGKLVPMSGVYIAPTWYQETATGQLAVNRYDLHGNVQTVTGRTVDDKVNGGKCAACALGGLFACAVERADGLKDLIHVRKGDEGRDFWRSSQQHMHKYLSPFFSTEQLALIETAFERSDFLLDIKMAEVCEREGLGGDDAWDAVKEDGRKDEWAAEAQKAIDFNDDVEAASDRMRRIMENVIANGGTFVV